MAEHDPVACEPITEDWLRQTGFKWRQEDRQPHKHWLLWIGGAIPKDRDDLMNSADDFGIELTMRTEAANEWLMWLRADYAGRYSRFLFARNVTTTTHVTRLIEALTDRPFASSDVLYGQYWRPAQAEYHRREAERLDQRFALLCTDEPRQPTQ